MTSDNPADSRTGRAATYSRPVYIEHPSDLAAGDLVDVSVTLLPCWATVDRVGVCADDADDPDCDGECRAVLFFTEAEQIAPLHLSDSDEIYARLAGAASQDDVAAENEAHAAAAAEEYAARVAAHTAAAETNGRAG